MKPKLAHLPNRGCRFRDARRDSFARTRPRFLPVLTAAASLLLGAGGLWVVLVVLSNSLVVEATPPIEDNPISIGGASEVLSALAQVGVIAAADIDRDGRADVAFGDGDSVRIVANPGGAAASWLVSNTVGAMPVAVRDLAVADLDRDGRLDLAVAASDAAGSGTLVLWQGPVAGDPFETPWDVSSTVTSSSAITLSTLAVGDLDGDGAPDLVAAGGDGSVLMWRNPMTGTTTFESAWGRAHLLAAAPGAIERLLLCDVDRDGRLDIAVVSGGPTLVVRVWQNPLAETFPFTTAWTVSNTLGVLGDEGLSLAAADLDGNGTPDLAVGSNGGEVLAWSNPLQGAQAFTTEWGGPVVVGTSDGPIRSLATGDLDRDGKSDLIGVADGSPSTVLGWRNPGTLLGPGWAEVTVGTLNDSVCDLATSDLDRDGDLDLLTGGGGTGSGYIVAWPNVLIHRDAPFLEPGTSVGPEGQVRGMLVGDLDRDGHLDIVAESGAGYIEGWKNNGVPFVSGWSFYSLGWRHDAVPRILADLDGDSYLDIVLGQWYGDEQLQLWRNDGTPFAGTWTDRHTIAAPAGRATAMAAGDLDGDGDLELAVGLAATEAVSPTIVVWSSDGDPFASTWVSAQVAVLSYTVTSLALGDLDNDGRLDIVFGTEHAPGLPDQDPSTYPDVYQLRAARNEGAPSGDGWTVFDLGRDPQWSGLVPFHGYWGATVWSVGVADLDNDGDLDVITGEGIEGDHQVMVWENDGTPFDGQLWQPTTAGLGPYWEADGLPWFEDSVFKVVPADLNGDGMVDLVSGSASSGPYDVRWWENSGVPFSELVTDTHWIMHNVADVGLPIQSVDAVDLDGDGDLDLASWAEAWSAVDVVHVWQNLGGAIRETAAATAPGSYEQGTTRELMRVTVSHEGQPQDREAELAEWRITFLDLAGTPLTSAEADALFDRLVIFRDADGDGAWQVGDTPVITVSAPALVGGVQRFVFPSGSELAAISAAQSVTYFLVGSLEADAGEQTPSAFQLRFDADAASIVKDRTNGATLSIGDSEPVTVGPVQAAGSVAKVALAADPSTIVASGVSTATLTATVLDGRDQWAADGTVVTFTTSLGAMPADPYNATTRSGVALATLTSDTTIGTASVTATAEGHVATASVSFAAGAVHHIVVNPPGVTLGVGETQSFLATGYDAYDHELSGLSFSWSVTHGGGAIDGGGIFTAGTVAGTYLNTAEASADGVTGTASVTVTAGELADIVIEPSAVSLGAGATQSFVATGYDAYGNEITGLSFVWSVIHGGGTIEDNGLFTAGTAAGTYLNTVQAIEGGVTGTASVTVIAGALDDIAVDPASVTLTTGGTQHFLARGYDAHDNEIGGLTFSWSVIYGGGTIDSSGLFTAGVTAGVYLDTVCATSGAMTGTASVTVVVGTLDHIVVNPASVTLLPEATQIFAATGYDEHGNAIQGLTFSWSVIHGGGTIDGSGRFTAGTTAGIYPGTVQATGSGMTGTASVTVLVGTLDHIVVDPDSVTLGVEETQLFTATGYDAHDNAIHELGFFWSVTGGGGTIDAGGLFTAGTTAGPYPDTVQATAKGVTGTASVTVTGGAVHHIVVSPEFATLAPAATQPFEAKGYDVHNNDLEGLVFSWNVVNGGGTIDGAGLFTAGSTGGVYPDTIRATAEGIHGFASVSIQQQSWVFLPVVVRMEP